MNLTYLYHSGFLVETERCYYIFDYYKGTLPDLDPAKPVLVFVSHSHADHYNPEIFSLLRKQGMGQVLALLSKDILKKRWPPELTPCPVEAAEAVNACPVPPGQIPAVKVTFHQSYTLPYGVTVQTLHSTDRGSAFLVKSDDCVVFHAGDLNDWGMDVTNAKYSEQFNKQMAGSYRHEINLLREWLGEKALDVAFLPLDPRQGDYYDRGILYFLKKIPTKAVYPMHYWEKPEIIGRFRQENPSYTDIIRYTPSAAAIHDELLSPPKDS